MGRRCRGRVGTRVGDAAKTIVWRVAIRTLSAWLEAGGGISKDIKLALSGIFYVFRFNDAIPIQRGYPLKPVLVVWSK